MAQIDTAAKVWILHGVHKGLCASLVYTSYKQLCISSIRGITPVCPRPVLVTRLPNGHCMFVAGDVEVSWSSRRPDYVSSHDGPDCDAESIMAVLRGAGHRVVESAVNETLRLMLTKGYISSVLLQAGATLDGCTHPDGPPAIVALAAHNPEALLLAIPNAAQLEGGFSAGGEPHSTIRSAIASAVERGRLESVTALVRAGILLEGLSLIELCIDRDLDLQLDSTAVADVIMGTGYALTPTDRGALGVAPQSAVAQTVAIWERGTHVRQLAWLAAVDGRLPLSPDRLYEADDLYVEPRRHAAVVRLRREAHVAAVLKRRS